MTDSSGTALSGGDDSSMSNATRGTFYVADTGANTVYAITASGLTPDSSLFADIGDEFGSVNTSTGVVTPIFTGTSPHGLEFVASVPEPASFGFMLVGLISCGLIVRHRWYARSR